MPVSAVYLPPWLHDHYTASELGSNSPPNTPQQRQNKDLLGFSPSPRYNLRPRVKKDYVMAPKKLNKYLVCFYCNLKSKKKQDGTIHRWECDHCTATNYLDKSGEITDPPAQTVTTNTNVSFTHATNPPKKTDDSAQPVFCEKCQKNQHLYNASLAQYLPDSDHPEYDRLSANLETFIEDLERRYPQVCETCVDRVEAKMKRAVYKAKADAHGRLLVKTRKLAASRSRQPRSWLQIVQDLGFSAWSWGIYVQMAHFILVICQALCTLTADSLIGDVSIVDEQDGFVTRITNKISLFGASTLYTIAQTFQPVMKPLGVAALWWSLLVIWWNPQFRFAVKQNLHTVLGLRGWYCKQIVSLVVRAVLFYITSETVLQSYPTVTAAAHLLMLFSVARMLTSEPKKVKVQQKKLFSAPNKASLITRKRSSESLRKGSNSMMDALEEIMDAPTVPSSPVTPSVHDIYNTSSPLARLSLKTIQQSDPDQMDWEPTQQTALPQTMALPTTVAPTPLFHHRLPPQPKHPAWKARNPVGSYPQKAVIEKQFNPFASKGVFAPMPSTKERLDYEFAQPRFFAPREMEDETGLADLLGRSFKIDDDVDDETPQVISSTRPALSQQSSPPRRVSTANAWIATALCVALWVWNLAVTAPGQYAAHIPYAAVIAPLAVSVSFVVDNGLEIASKSGASSSYWGMIFGVAEAAMGASILSKLYAGGNLEVFTRHEGTAFLLWMIGHALVRSRGFRL